MVAAAFACLAFPNPPAAAAAIQYSPPLHPGWLTALNTIQLSPCATGIWGWVVDGCLLQQNIRIFGKQKKCALLPTAAADNNPIILEPSPSTSCPPTSPPVCLGLSKKQQQQLKK